MLRTFIHYGIHFLVPVLIWFIWYRKDWKILLLLWAGILIDVDHLWASPIFDPNRCSIGYHPLHTYWAMGVYFLLLFPKKTRIIGIALWIHMVADIADCWLMA